MGTRVTIADLAVVKAADRRIVAVICYGSLPGLRLRPMPGYQHTQLGGVLLLRQGPSPNFAKSYSNSSDAVVETFLWSTFAHLRGAPADLRCAITEAEAK